MRPDAVGLLARLAGFLNTFAATGARSAGTQRRPEPDRHQLAVQLLGTLRPEVLVETGHRKPHPRRLIRTEDLVLRQPHPPPVGDLSRPRR
jgi:beta-phosphoglucomutase-like phosphatase (HAD superfamily)